MKITQILFLLLIISCTNNEKSLHNPYVMILGVAQDAGYPQIDCTKQCCERTWNNPKLKKSAVCLAIVDPISNEQWLIEATPDIKNQLHVLKKESTIQDLNGIILTHAHIGHYSGLIHLGREVMGSTAIPVYTMPKMKKFLENNGPWSQLVELNNINIFKLKEDSTFYLNPRISITPFLVPHRDEFSETAGYTISINEKKLMFIPDIDKWETWEKNIIEIIKKIDYALIDGTFYKDGEIDRDMSEIPHPFVEESINLFSKLDDSEKNKIYFIHFNHTNPLLIENSWAQKEVKNKGFNISEEKMKITF